MPLTLYLHPLASFCHKVLIALYENGTPFEPVDRRLRRSAVGGRLPGALAGSQDPRPPRRHGRPHDPRDHHHHRVSRRSTIRDRARFCPTNAGRRLDARLWDRFFDLYVSVPMQKIVTDRLRPEAERDPTGVAEAHKTLDVSYAMVEAQLAGKTWAIGDDFSIADCAAAPGLFFAAIVHPFDDRSPQSRGLFRAAPRSSLVPARAR